VRLWNAYSGGELAVLCGHGNSVTSMSYSPDGRRIVSGSYDGTVRVWDAQSGIELVVLRGHEGGVGSVAYSPDGRRIVSGGGMFDETVRVWDAEDGIELAVLCGHEDHVRGVSCASDGQVILNGSRDETIRVWDEETGESRRGIVPEQRDVATIASEVSSGPPWRTIERDWETVIESTTGGGESVDVREIVSGSSDETGWAQDVDAGESTMEIIPDPRYVAAIDAATALGLPWCAIGDDCETVIEPTAGGEPLAVLPVELEHIISHPNGHTWGGSAGSHLYIITLEGVPEAQA